MGLLRRIFGGGSGEAEAATAPPAPRVGLRDAVGGPYGTSATGSSGTDGDSHWRGLAPMPRALPLMSPVLQLQRFEASLPTRSQPTLLAPLVHDRAAEHPSGVAEGIAVLTPPPSQHEPGAEPDAAAAGPVAETPPPGAKTVRHFLQRRSGPVISSLPGATDQATAAPPAAPWPSVASTASAAATPSTDGDAHGSPRGPLDPPSGNREGAPIGGAAEATYGAERAAEQLRSSGDGAAPSGAG
ncbi:MAG TPA: hypothetical protein VME46_21590, partial [Acidimicrobiales bacterium]|nr:hypothetical protein [Acidimicrobiales bacterium]